MDLRESDLLKSNIDEHWYYRSKAQMLSKVINRRVSKLLDVGAGSAYFSKYLIREKEIKRSHCVDPNYSSASVEEYSNGIIYYVKELNENLGVDLVLMMDVLEHVDNDVDLIKQYSDKVELGTTFMITVPAFNFLWSKHDDYLGHKRRYDLSQIEDVIRLSGLDIKSSFYYFGSIFPIVAITRFVSRIIYSGERKPISDLRTHSKLVNFVLYCICRLEVYFMHRNKLFGLTAVVVAMKTKV